MKNKINLHCFFNKNPIIIPNIKFGIINETANTGSYNIKESNVPDTMIPIWPLMLEQYAYITMGIGVTAPIMLCIPRLLAGNIKCIIKNTANIIAANVSSRSLLFFFIM